MRKPADGKLLASEILSRSQCSVQVGAAIVDSTGRIISWGWNSMGPDGYGLHAEHHAIQRANKRRLAGATIFIASVRNRNNKVVISKPCPDCQRLIAKWKLQACWRSNMGDWIHE